MSMWGFYQCIVQDIKRLGGEEFYKVFGQEMLDYIAAPCTEDFGTEVVRYPGDEEVVEAINYFRAKQRRADDG